MSNASLRKQKKSEKVPELQPPGVLGSKIHSAENPKCVHKCIKLSKARATSARTL